MHHGLVSSLRDREHGPARIVGQRLPDRPPHQCLDLLLEAELDLGLSWMDVDVHRARVDVDVEDGEGMALLRQQRMVRVAHLKVDPGGRLHRAPVDEEMDARARASASVAG